MRDQHEICDADLFRAGARFPPQHSQLISTIMPPGNRRHIPIAIKELIVTLQTKKGLKKREVAELLDVNARTVRCITKLEAETGLVVREPLVKGPHRLLNGIDCAVRQCLIYYDTYVFSNRCSILSHSWKECQISTCMSSKRISL